MRATYLFILLATAVGHTRISAQTRALELQAGLGYARAFDGGGVSFAAAVERPLSHSTSFRHALGGSLWYSEMSIGSEPTSSNARHLLGIGMRYQLHFRRCCGPARPFLAVPLQLLQSRIPDRVTTLQASSTLLTAVPDPGPPKPVEDRTGAEWGWGTGLEVGFQVQVSQQFSAQTSVQGLYQRIYESGNRHGAWSWHAGFAYAFQGS